MRSAEVVDIVHAAMEKHPGEKPRIVHDNGPQFTGKEFRELIKRFGSVAGVRRATIEELASVPGISRALAERIHQHLND